MTTRFLRLIAFTTSLVFVGVACGSTDRDNPIETASGTEPTATSEPAAAAGPEPTATAEPDPTAEPAPPVPTTEARDLDLPDATTEAPDDESNDMYPPGDEPSLAAIVDPMVVDLGVSFTYGSLIDRTAGGTYEASATGDHLAIYVEPINNDYTDAEFVANTWELAARLTPYLFERYPGIHSYDICQEPRTAEDDSARPPPFTQLDIFRPEAEAIDWENGRLASLISAAADEPTLTLRLDDRLQQIPEFVTELRAID